MIGESETDPSDVGAAFAAFVRVRLRLQQHIRDLKEAHEQGLALEMAIAMDNLDDAAIALAVSVQDLRTHKACVETQIRAALYECQALDELIAALVEDCLRRSRPEPCPRLPQDDSPAERNLLLRERLIRHAARIHYVLSRCSDERFSIGEIDHG